MWRRLQRTAPDSALPRLRLSNGLRGGLRVRFWPDDVAGSQRDLPAGDPRKGGGCRDIAQLALQHGHIGHVSAGGR